MKTVKIAVVGLGRIGWQFHLPNIKQHDGFELVAVVDPLQERREEGMREYSVRGYAEYADLLANESLDVVVLASPTHMHADQAIAAMEQGIDVFCDKPMTTILDDADRMIAAQERTGRKLMVYQPHRATAEVQAVRYIMNSGLLGDIYMIKHSVSWYVRRNDWQALKQYGGGMLSNYGAHYIDQLLYLTGSRPARTTCALRAIATLGDADDVVKGLLEMENGVIVDVEINMAAGLSTPAWHILGKQGAALMTADKSGFLVQYLKPEELSDLKLNTKLAATDRMYGSGEQITWHTQDVKLADFAPLNFYDKCYDYFALDQAPFVPVAETREVMRILEECRENAGWADAK